MTVRNIVEIMKEAGLILSPHGSGFETDCPFCDADNHSLKVSHKKQKFLCVECNAGGGVEDFLARNGETQGETDNDEGKEN